MAQKTLIMVNETLEKVPVMAILELCNTISQNKQLKLTVHHSIKGALVTGLGAFIGGLLGGPPGLAIGGAAAAIYSGTSASGKFKSVIAVIRDDMTEKQRIKLANAVWEAIKGVNVCHVGDIASFVELVMKNINPDIEERVTEAMKDFFFKEMKKSFAQ